MAQSQNWWDEFPEVGQAAPATPGIIRGRPKVPDALELRRDDRAEAASLRADAAAQRATDAAARQAALDERKLANEAKGNEGERTAAFLATRLAGSLADINRITAGEPAAASPELDTAIFNSVGVPRGATNTAPRQRVEDAQLDILDAALTLGTGAAYTREQLEGYRQSYFPTYWDSPEAVADKKDRLQRVLDAARIKAGAAAPLIDKALQVGASPAPAPQDTPTAVTTAPDGALEFSVTDDSPTPPPADPTERNSVMGTVDAVIRGIADTATFGFADEIAAAGDTIFGGGTMDQNLARQRGIDRTDAQVNPIARGAGQLAGAVAVPLGAGARGAGQLAAVGGVGGAAYGFGSGEDLASRGIGAAQGGAAGALGGYALGKAAPIVGNALAPLLGRAAPSVERTERNALMQAAQRQGIDPLPADVGGPMTRRMTSAAAQAPLSAGSVIRGGQRVQEQARTARDRVADSVGQRLDPEAAGEAAKAGAGRFRVATAERANRLYQRAEELTKGVKITPTRTVQALDQNIAELQATPGVADGPQVAALTKLRDQIAGGNFTVSGIRGMRTALRQQYMDDGLRSNDFQRRVGGVIDAAGEDMAQNLAESGMEEAAQTFRAADGFWRTRVQTIDDVISPIIGRKGEKSGEQVMTAIESAAKGNGRRLQRFVTALPPEEKAAIQASVIGRLGVKRGDAGAEEFSLDVLSSQWDAMTPRAKAALFDGDTRSALNDLAKVAKASKSAGQYANRSNTGGAIAGNITAIGASGYVLGPVVAAIGAAGQYAGGRLLASPGFARWVARAPKSGNPAAIRAHANRLAGVATQYPALRNEIQGIQQRLLESVNNQPRLAAEEPDQSR